MRWPETEKSSGVGVLRLELEAALVAPEVPVEVHPGLFEVQLITPAAAEHIRTSAEAVKQRSSELRRHLTPPNSMHYAGFRTKEVGWDAVLTKCLGNRMAGLASALFPEAMPGAPTGCHSFLVDYGPEADRDLSLHVDDSQVTFNLWLGGDAEGTEVRFEGMRCVGHLQSGVEAEEAFSWVGRPGRALVHRGLHRHRTLPVYSGERQSLIFWLTHEPVRERWLGGESSFCPLCSGSSR